MKTNERMMPALLGAAMCSFFFGLGQREVPADPVLNCVQSCCENVWCWYPGTDGSDCFTAQTSGATYPFGAGTNLNTAIPNAWVPVASGLGCKIVQTLAHYDQYEWPSATEQCWTAKGGYWQFPQPATNPSVIPWLAPALVNGGGQNQTRCSN